MHFASRALCETEQKHLVTKLENNLSCLGAVSCTASTPTTERKRRTEEDPPKDTKKLNQDKADSRWRDGEPTHDELQDLAEYLSDIWKRLGPKLGVEPNTIRRIDKDNISYGDLQQKAYAMLEFWIDSGLTQTYAKLGEALLALKKEKLAEQFCGRE